MIKSYFAGWLPTMDHIFNIVEDCKFWRTQAFHSLFEMLIGTKEHKIPATWIAKETLQHRSVQCQQLCNIFSYQAASNSTSSTGYCHNRTPHVPDTDDIEQPCLAVET